MKLRVPADRNQRGDFGQIKLLHVVLCRFMALSIIASRVS